MMSMAYYQESLLTEVADEFIVTDNETTDAYAKFVEVMDEISDMMLVSKLNVAEINALEHKTDEKSLLRRAELLKEEVDLGPLRKRYSKMFEVQFNRLRRLGVEYRVHEDKINALSGWFKFYYSISKFDD